MLKRLHCTHVFTSAGPGLVSIEYDLLPVIYCEPFYLGQGIGAELVQYSTNERVSRAGGVNRYDRYTGNDDCFTLDSQQGTILPDRHSKNSVGLLEEYLYRIVKRITTSDQHCFLIADLEEMATIKKIPRLINECLDIIFE